MFTAVHRRRLNQVIRPLIFLIQCVRVCVSTVEGKHSADAAKFPLEGRSREGGKKKNRYSSKILMAE